MDVRPTVADDLPVMHRLFLAAIGSVYEPHDFEPPAPPAEVFASNHGHLLATDPERCFVAASDGEVVGYVAAWLRGDDWFLGSLFIAPPVHGRGVGSRLLDAVWGDGDVRRRTLTDAIQPVSNALYARRGLVPSTPLLTFVGFPAGAEPTLAVGNDASVADIDLRAYGFDRAADHRYWGEIAERTVWLRDGKPVAYSYRFPAGAIGPVAGLDAGAAAAALAGELARVVGPVVVRIPGSSRALVLGALAAGLRLSPTPGLLLLSEGLAPPDALAIGGYTLF
ncbi:MAG TPA: GNAT family N-acetyltransferase [Gaiellaceae bacterium]